MKDRGKTMVMVKIPLRTSWAKITWHGKKKEKKRKKKERKNKENKQR